MDAASGELLLLLLDTSLFGSAAAHGVQGDVLLQQLLVFLRAHQLLSEYNHQAIMALTPHSSPVLYTPEACLDTSGGSDGGGGGGDVNTNTSSSSSVCGPQALPQLLIDRLAHLLQQQQQQQQQLQQQPGSTSSITNEVALSAGLSRALCYVHRYAGRYGASARRRAKPRLLALMGSADLPLQYIPVMNGIFAAQASGVVLDALVLGQAESAFLQQATHLTGGLYMRVSQPAGLLQYLLGAFSADSVTRADLSISGSGQVVDYRASCFCHKAIIDTGYICSVCLSIFCKANMKAPQCLTCGAPFKSKGGAAGGGAGGAGAAAAASSAAA